MVRGGAGPARVSVEQLVARRWRTLLVSSAVFGIYTVMICSQIQAAPMTRTDWVQPSGSVGWAIAWVLWAVALAVAAFGTPAWWRRTPEEREVVNDDVTQANRLVALRNAVIALVASTMLAALGSFGMWTPPLWWPILTVSVGELTAVISFAVLDKRADE